MWRVDLLLLLLLGPLDVWLLVAIAGSTGGIVFFLPFNDLFLIYIYIYIYIEEYQVGTYSAHLYNVAKEPVTVILSSSS